MLDPCRFGNNEIRPAERQVLVDGAPAALGARAFDLLTALIERRDRVVDKSELFDAVWPGLVVEENNLQVQVSSLRKLLGPNAIATVPGRGYQFVAAIETGAAAAAKGDRPAAYPNNLPLPRTRFIGREKALSDCTTLLRDTRLLTLSGIGGCGKTRLARELAQRELGEFPDGVWFVDLGPLQDARRVAATVASTLGLKDAIVAPLERLAGHLRTRRTLVVLDSCEHVIDAAAESAETLLGSCSALKIVVTSREALGMAGEQVFAVRSLSLPVTTDLAEMQRSEAVRLFVDHARLVLPEFAVDERNAPAIAEICRRLDGIALAIELAAARIRVLSVDEIRARLDDRFRLLTGGNRAMPRHQTLHATMQWSHDPLDERERRLFRRLAVFAGGCTLAAAAQVADDEDDEYATLEVLTALHDKSLLVVDRDTQAQPRYRMLETVRQYAEERLNEAGEGDAVRNRHLMYYVALGERAAPQLYGFQQGEWFVALRPEQENLIAAHAWCAHAPRGGATALRLYASLWRYWRVTSQPETGYRIGQAVQKLAGDEPDSRDRGETLWAMAVLALHLGRYPEALLSAEQSLAIGRTLGEAVLTARALNALGAAFHAMGENDRALACYQEALDAARTANEPNQLGSALNGMGEIQRDAGNLAEAEALYEQAFRTKPAGACTTLANLSAVLIGQHKLDRARVTLTESLAIARQIGNRGHLECALDVAAALAAASGCHSAAARFHGAAIALLRDAGTRHEPVDERFIAGWMENARAKMGSAAFEAAETQGKALAHDSAIAEMDEWLRTRDQSPNHLPCT